MNYVSHNGDESVLNTNLKEDIRILKLNEMFKDMMAYMMKLKKSENKLSMNLYKSS